MSKLKFRSISYTNTEKLGRRHYVLLFPFTGTFGWLYMALVLVVATSHSLIFVLLGRSFENEGYGGSKDGVSNDFGSQGFPSTQMVGGFEQEASVGSGQGGAESAHSFVSGVVGGFGQQGSAGWGHANLGFHLGLWQQGFSLKSYCQAGVFF